MPNQTRTRRPRAGRLRAALALQVAICAALSHRAGAQQATGTASADTTPAPAKTATPSLPFDLSGVIYTNYQYGGTPGSRSQNRFELDRAYLTLRGLAGERVSWRVTADVYQQRDTASSAYYRGWAARFKYAYVQYDYLRGAKGDGWKANARLGMLHTVLVDHEEQFWQRGLAQVAVEQAGFFSSSDMGVATTVSFPHKAGEVYATITNGSGYASREVDRFKDYAARLTLTPLANTAGPLRGLTISPWYSRGGAASAYAGRQRGVTLPASYGLQKDRYGVLVAVRDPRIVVGAHYARRIDETDRADTLRAVVPTVTSHTGSVGSLYTIVRPLALLGSASDSPLAIVLRGDEFTPDVDADAAQRFYIAGLQWALNARTSVTLDYQRQQPRNGSTAADLRTVFVHLIANF